MKELQVEFFQKQGEWYGQVVKQSHRGSEFTRFDSTAFESQLYPNCELQSESCPEAQETILFVRGSNKLADDNIVQVDASQVPIWQAIIAEYNEYYKDKAEVEPCQVPTKAPSKANEETIVLTLHKESVNGVLMADLSKAFEDDDHNGTYKWSIKGGKMCLIQVKET